MDAFDYSDAPEASTARDTKALVWNILTIVALLATFCVGAVFLTLFINPQAGINPFPPPTLPEAMQFPTATNTSQIQLMPTWTATNTNEPTSTFTPRPTTTKIPAFTDTPVGFTPVATTPLATGTPPTETPGGFSFVLQHGSPSAISSVSFHPDTECNWMGVAGQATSMSGSPVFGLFVQVGGSLAGEPIDTMLSMTGTAPQYGQGGFEFTLADRPVASDDGLWIQLLDQANLPLSEKVYFDTLEDCDKNLIIIYFTQVK
jgi:hypothetical protein